MLLVIIFNRPKMFCNKPRTLLSSLYFHLTQYVKLLSKHLEANFKHLLGMELVTDVVFLVVSSENNDLTIYVFATGVGCKIRSVGSTELKNVPYLSSRAACTINVSVKETSMFRLKTCMLSFLEKSKYLTWKDCSLIKKRHISKHSIIKTSILGDMKIYVVWYFWTIRW